MECLALFFTIIGKVKRGEASRSSLISNGNSLAFFFFFVFFFLIAYLPRQKVTGTIIKSSEDLLGI